MDKALHIFNTAFLASLDKVAPIKTVRIKQRSEKWINEEILMTIRARNSSLKSYKKNKDPADFKSFKSLRNRVNRMVTKAKKEYFSDRISECKDDPKKLWKCLKEVGYSNKSISKSSISLKIDGSVS